MRRLWIVGACVTAVVVLTLRLSTNVSGPGIAAADPPTSHEASAPARDTLRFPLTAPSRVSVAQFEAKLFAFLQGRRYVELGWTKDKQVRDTGPYIDGTYYGTHPAVRVFYSPGIIEWLKRGRVGVIPDGEMIVKEQFLPPAIRHQGKTEEQLWESLESWTVMVKDSAGSHDGWFWSNPGKDQQVVDNHADFSHPLSGFGMYCVRCHTAAHSPGEQPQSPANEFTFVAERNIEGFAGDPIIFRVDDSWRDASVGEGTTAEEPTEDDAAAETAGETAAAEETSADTPAAIRTSDGTHPDCARSGTSKVCIYDPDERFLNFFTTIEPVTREEVSFLPPVTHDRVAKRRDDAQQFVTSNQCMSCHAGLLAPFGPTMFIPTGEDKAYGAPGWDVSPFGEWRWTPMGLAGRDPFFLAQLESELAMLEDEFADDPARQSRLSNVLQDTCLRCHGPMGRHQFQCDRGDPEDAELAAAFSLEMCEATADDEEHVGRGEDRYGALAREGVSCMICHRMQPRPQPEDDPRPYLQFYLENSVTGKMHFGPVNEVYGPFKDDEITPYPMQHALGITPKHHSYLQSSQLCGTCHTVSLPAVDRPVDVADFDELNKAQAAAEFRDFHHHVEQATYLEWLNSDYENEIRPRNPQAKTCQDCHMSRGLADEAHGIDIDQIATRIAVIQDETYPVAEHLAPHEQLRVRIREQGFARHNFSGLNLFLLELFDQFEDVLGVRTQNFMTGSPSGIEQARQNFLQTARSKTADIAVDARWHSPRELSARVVVTNKAGHRFPSGVGFRRAFLELLVVESPQEPDGTERIVWASGRTNPLGVLVDASGRPLRSEFFQMRRGGQQEYQPHHDVISGENQVQIYESLVCNAQGQLTTSFIHICRTIKDNRLLPRGWSKDGPGPALEGRYLRATYPQGEAAQDQRYQDGSGTDETTYRISLPEGLDSERLQVRASLYYQAVPPYFLKNLFQAAPEGEATRRLHYLLSHADLSHTPIKDWKLKITSAETQPARP